MANLLRAVLAAVVAYVVAGVVNRLLLPSTNSVVWFVVGAVLFIFVFATVYTAIKDGPRALLTLLRRQ